MATWKVTYFTPNVTYVCKATAIQTNALIQCFVMNDIFLNFRKFSRIRSNTTTVSLIE